MELIEIVKEYFKLFSKKDINALKSLFSKDIILKDWDINVKGINNVIETNEKIFKSVETILVTPIAIYQDGFVLVCEINILVNNPEKIRVIDIIKFNKNKKIQEISAFKQ